MAKETYYWVGPGTFGHRTPKGRKSIGFGDAMPADISKETLASLVKKKKVSTSAPRGPVTIVSPDIQKLQARIAELEDELAAANQNVTALTEQLTGGAGPKDGAK